MTLQTENMADLDDMSKATSEKSLPRQSLDFAKSEHICIFKYKSLPSLYHSVTGILSHGMNIQIVIFVAAASVLSGLTLVGLSGNYRHFLRLIFVNVGVQHDESCNVQGSQDRTNMFSNKAHHIEDIIHGGSVFCTEGSTKTLNKCRPSSSSTGLFYDTSVSIRYKQRFTTNKGLYIILNTL